MSAQPIPHLGNDLTPEDYSNLASRWITPELASAAGLRRVDSTMGRVMFGRKTGTLAGVVIPNILPGQTHPRRYRGWLDKPNLERCIDGVIKERQKFIQPANSANLMYFPPGATASALGDVALPVIITDDEFKAIALLRLAEHQSTSPRFLPLAIPGVWGFRDTIGRSTGPNGGRDVTGVIPDFNRVAWKERRVVIAYDADADGDSRVRAARNQLTTALMERGALAGPLEWPLAEGARIDEHLSMVGPDRVLADIAAVDFADWHTRLLRSESGKMLACYENASLFLEKSPEWFGVLGFNEFTGGHVIQKPPPRPVTATAGQEIEDHFDTEVVRWLERRGVMVRPDVVRRVVDVLARRSRFHPVRDYLESLPPWDGVPRIGRWLIDYCGVESDPMKPNLYATAVGEKFLISAIARVMQPGCKVDHCLILEGPQGLGKSTVPRILAGDDWFSDQIADVGSKDASMQLRGVWILEFAELTVLSRVDSGRLKGFLTQQTERFRLPYGQRIVTLPRQCVFIGTTNSENWQKDETGGRRFWPVRCQTIDLGRLRIDRDQLWAETLLKFRAGETWWLDDPQLVLDATEEQGKRFEADPWQALIEAWLPTPTQRPDPAGSPITDFTSTPSSVTVSDVLAHCLGKRPDLWTQADQTRVARSLQALGWERFRGGKTQPRQWRYRPLSQS